MLAALRAAWALLALAAGASGLSARTPPEASVEATVFVTFDKDERLGVDSRLDSTSEGRTTMLSNGTHCLEFVHIPKTGGTTVEHVDHAKLYDHGWGKVDASLTCDNMRTCPPFRPWNNHSRCCPMKDGSSCSVWHVPPAADHKLEEQYKRCETFCVVREPAARFRSQHAWGPGGNGACTTEALREAVQAKLYSLRRTPYQDDCHLVPQVEFYNGGKTCQHVVKHDNFEEEFTALMARFGLKANISTEPLQYSGCHAAFDQESLQMLHEYYADDYATFGYSTESARS